MSLLLAIRGFLLIFLIYASSHAGEHTGTASRSITEYRPRFNSFGGEKASYQASWNGVPVASAELHTNTLLVEGEEFYQVKIRARTSRYLDAVWRMRDTIESVFEPGSITPRSFIFRQRENRRKLDTIANFDSRNQKWVVQRVQGRKVRNFEFVSPHTMDPVSAAYLVRSVDFKIGDTLRIDVFGGKSRYRVLLEIVGKEPVSLRSGSYDAYKLVPRIWNLSRDGYAGKLRQATIWISADEKRRPLKIVSQVFVGSVSIEMIEDKT